MNDIWLALGGGALLGVSASILMLFNGKVAGISGILASSMRPKHPGFSWSLLFSVGVVCGGYMACVYFPKLSLGAIKLSLPQLVIAGLCVGIGTRLANGCTSGHGICGMGRRSIRSVVATGIFMLVAGFTAYINLHLL
ncbi:YeeE/YedE family protein [Vibrio salinus]|uniref:YeeE/YedE family protein n=1 Tax=Vibrio salinus TaxID=2899784 RepID=UPI001E305D08|nr:YeeE/YedE thiosulfate transporter family protein [Vibrio salinus]MCE0495386.1 YeeE/YedE family protein [Vibrio salinus]